MYTKNEEELQSLGERLGYLLEKNDVLILTGELGAGKTTFSYDQLREIAKLVHDADKELIVAVNALMHQDMMDRIKPFLDFFISRTS